MGEVSGAGQLVELLRPILEEVSAYPLEDAAGAAELRAWLEEAYPLAGEEVQAIHRLCREGLAAGWLCDRAAGGARFSRVAKAGEATRGYSVDAVLSRGAGVEHTHPHGEINLCLAESGAPVFDGHAPGWAVYPPGSRHRPDVSGGEMLLLYLLPAGSIEWHR